MARPCAAILSFKERAGPQTGPPSTNHARILAVGDVAGGGLGVQILNVVDNGARIWNPRSRLLVLEDGHRALWVDLQEPAQFNAGPS